MLVSQINVTVLNPFPGQTNLQVVSRVYVVILNNSIYI